MGSNHTKKNKHVYTMSEKDCIFFLMTGDSAFACAQAACLQKLHLPMLNGVLIRWISTMSRKVC